MSKPIPQAYYHRSVIPCLEWLRQQLKTGLPHI